MEKRSQRSQDALQCVRTQVGQERKEEERYQRWRWRQCWPSLHTGYHRSLTSPSRIFIAKTSMGWSYSLFTVHHYHKILLNKRGMDDKMEYKGVNSVCMSVYCNFHRERGQNGQAIPRGLTLTWLDQCWVQWCVEVDGDRHVCRPLVQTPFLSFVFYLSFFLQDTRQQLNFLGGRGWGELVRGT